LRKSVGDVERDKRLILDNEDPTIFEFGIHDKSSALEIASTFQIERCLEGCDVRKPQGTANAVNDGRDFGRMPAAH
jgi:hypothetical protein